MSITVVLLFVIMNTLLDIFIRLYICIDIDYIVVSTIDNDTCKLFE